MSFSFLYVISKKNPVSPYVIFYKKETDNISAQEGKKTGKIVYVNDNGEQAVIKDGVNGEIAAVLTVGREEIGKELKKEGYAGTDREIDIILNGGFRQYAEDQKGEIIGDAVCVAIGDAACRGQIEYADEYRRALRANGCEVIECFTCSECEHGVCYRYGDKVDSETAMDCSHYSNDMQVCLKEKCSLGKSLELPLVFTISDEKVDKQKILEIAKNSPLCDYMIKDFIADAKKRGHGVTLVRAEVRYKDTEDCEG